VSGRSQLSSGANKDWLSATDRTTGTNICSIVWIRAQKPPHRGRVITVHGVIQPALRIAEISRELDPLVGGWGAFLVAVGEHVKVGANAGTQKAVHFRGAMDTSPYPA